MNSNQLNMYVVTKKTLAFLVVLFSLFFANSLKAQESVTIRTDRDTYIGGESVWLTVNCVKSGTSQISELSQVVYIELLNHNNSPLHQLKLKLENGVASTKFILSDTLSTGNYLLRGYTKWMRNYNVDFYFYKTISLVNPFVKNRFPKNDKAHASDTVVFYPEGGEIILNNENIITFRCVDAFDNGQKIEGEIINSNNEFVTAVETNKLGFGKFRLHPNRVEKYNVRFKHDGKNIVLPLPDISESGFCLQLSEIGDSIVFNLGIQGNQVLEVGDLQLVTATGELLEKHKFHLKSKNQFKLNKKKYSNQYLCALLLNADGEQLTSRYFVCTSNTISEPFNLELSKKHLANREQLTVYITKNKELASVSVSVIKSCLKNEHYPIGNGEQLNSFPSRLLKQYADSTISINDLLRCFKPFEKVLDTGSGIVFLPEMEGEIISGNLRDKNSLEPISNEKLILNFVGQAQTIDFSTTDPNGHFNFVANRFGENEMVIQPFRYDDKELNYRIDLDQSFCKRYSKGIILPFFMDKLNAQKMNAVIVNMQINEQFSSINNYPLEVKKTIDPICFYGQPNITVLIDKFINLPTMEEVIREIVPYTTLQRNDGHYRIKIFEDQTQTFSDGESFVLVDGVHIKDEDRVLKIDPARLDRIVVVNRNYFIEENKLGRIFSVFTKSGDLSAMSFDDKIFRQAQQCYAPYYQFSSPDYSSDSIKNSRIPDYRNLLYWNPEVNFNNQNQAGISFYTSDEVADYLLVVEGLNVSGEIERTVLPISVRNKK
jgi:hypothetical protein